MSRCFPFPPPGYVKKARTDDVDLLNKEKQKEKKDKEKEKSEKKEKKEKDRNDGKHKDKKDKKEKHKDKHKKKERSHDKEKEKDRSNNSEEKKFPDHPDGQNGERASDEKKFRGKPEVHSGKKFIPKAKDRDKDQSSFPGEKKLAGHISSYNGEKIGKNSHLVEDFRDSKFVQELAGRVRDEGAGARSQLADKVMGSDQKRDEGMVSSVAKTANKLAEEMEKTKRSDDRRFDVQGIREETRAGGNAMVLNLSGAVKARVEGIPKQVKSNTERPGEGREKVKEKEEGKDKIRDKRKDKDREKKSHGKDKDRDKKKEKKKAKSDHKNLELDNLKGSNKDEPVGTINVKTSHHPSKEGNNGAVADENFHKRKDLEKNGFLHVDDIKPNKLPKTSSAQPLVGNGRTSESCQAPIPLTLDSKGIDNNKKRKVNGTFEAQPLSVSSTKHLSLSAQASQIDEVPIKLPHPDAKYLSQVLSVTKMEEWFGFDDQSWLSVESQSKKPKVGFSEIDEPPQVWAEALQIESADHCFVDKLEGCSECFEQLTATLFCHGNPLLEV